MPLYHVRASRKLNLTSHSGLALLGRSFEAAQVDNVANTKPRVKFGMRTSDLVKSAVGTIAMGKPDFY